MLNHKVGKTGLVVFLYLPLYNLANYEQNPPCSQTHSCHFTQPSTANRPKKKFDLFDHLVKLENLGSDPMPAFA